MTQEDKKSAEQPTENDSLASADQTGGKQPTGTLNRMTLISLAKPVK